MSSNEPREVTRHRNERWVQIAHCIRLRDDEECQVCGETNAPKGRSLPVHHITRAAKIPIDRDPHVARNLITVCYSCHRQVEALPPDEQLALCGFSSRRELDVDEDLLSSTNQILINLGRQPLMNGEMIENSRND